MQIPEFWRRLTTTHRARTLEAELALERAVVTRLDAVIAQQGAEITRLRAENRALLNSILGIAGIPPLSATEADLAAVQAATHAASISVGARHIEDPALFRGAVPERATSTHTPSTYNRATSGSESWADTPMNGTIQPSSMAGHGSAVPLLTESTAADFRTAGVSPAPLPLGLHRTEMLEQQQNPNSKTPARRRRYEERSPGTRTANHSRPRANATPHVAAPTRRRSWPQIHRLLEFESAQKEKRDADPLPPARV
jgi:uncharacterized coiled-coil protein SlyX